jgi:hypothetical protein
VTGEKKRRLALSPIFRKTSASVGFRQSISVQRATVAGTLKQATLIKFPKAEAAAELIGKVELDALAMGTGPCTICQESYPAPECWRK